MAYEYKFTPALEDLVECARKNSGVIGSYTVSAFVSNARSSFFKLRKLGYSVEFISGNIRGEFLVRIMPPKKENKIVTFFLELDFLLKLILLALAMLEFLMIASFLSRL